MPEIPLFESVSFKVSKYECSEQNSKILRAIHNKIGPLNVSHKIVTFFLFKKLRMGRDAEFRKRNPCQFSFNWEEKENRLKDL